MVKTCSCGAELDNSAAACPRCGRQFTPTYAWVFGIPLPLGGILLIAYSCTR